MLATGLRPPDLSARVSAGLLLLRLVAGAAFVVHGWGKIRNPFGWMGPDAPIPGVFQSLAAVAEFGGGIAWILGLLTPLASFGLACTMAVATYMHLAVWHDPFVRQGPGGAWVVPATYFCIAALFLLAGPGRWSADRCLFRERTA
jgi:putative oxidoreductase